MFLVFCSVCLSVPYVLHRTCKSYRLTLITITKAAADKFAFSLTSYACMWCVWKSISYENIVNRHRQAWTIYIHTAGNAIQHQMERSSHRCLLKWMKTRSYAPNRNNHSESQHMDEWWLRVFCTNTRQACAMCLTIRNKIVMNVHLAHIHG